QERIQNSPGFGIVRLHVQAGQDVRTQGGTVIMKRGRAIMLHISLMLACAVGLFGCAALEDEEDGAANVAALHHETADEIDRPEDHPAHGSGSALCEDDEVEVEPGVCSYIVD